ncbi:zinc metalloprotease [uncultured Lutibacter sp.]|uniref:zinc metalloprotease n=1 Tax=uncultured Lutibacter sp. TaxID=437739 RepID=UPI00261A2D82|nr:zinc metalloprotease [uncultured Lutibacter sp.]
MKKLILFFAILALAIVACQDNTDEVSPNQEITEIDMSDFYVYTDDDVAAKSSQGSHGDKCHSMKVLNRQLNENPGLYKKLYNVEKHTRTYIAFKGKPTKPGNGNGNGGGTTPTPYTGTITIPVVVNILEDPAHPVTAAHINSQIAILNEDFNNNNPLTSQVPAEFAGLVADTDITFVLDQVIRKESTKSSWGTNDAMKDSEQGGIDASDPANKLNFWVCEIGGGILGYAQFPGGSPATDGVVIGSDFFGENTAGGQYGHGRTATHEVGHWLNLRHIWGDGRCKQDDFVSDTPSSDGPNYGCPSYPTVNCRSNDMTMNYMDYVNDNCMYMFSEGQNDRMRAIFATGGTRESFVQ